MSSDTSLHGDVRVDLPVGSWRIDPMHTAVTFSVRHLMSKVRGRFDDVDGLIRPAASSGSWSVEAVIGMGSVNTGVPMRDDDLRSVNFFDVAQFPTMRFVSTEVIQEASGYRIVGELTIRDTTRSVPIEVDFLGVDESGLQGEQRVGFSGRATVYRADFGVGAGPVQGSKLVVGDEVTIELDVEAFLEE